mmetsp:Transcript_22242/g.36126  ORF Transcript_22242/g.36126 Transcript_22242/m.36126 type:complete len:119 (+) Transcript_22242:159-515(+)|eukprot:CAMPEP_0196248504 /NCGR_PEP_ID=MMETSP0913-20130531/40602_1 /TAXON_ID=49265 /ORGANISM="Thalassiosira rotula, Strain GSO102" /LENGTH=118 /DNA_ID=CAMNT_0041533791 /DNA_START=130 /DNA_END=486 /DNA_ORIENTATION=+
MSHTTITDAAAARDPGGRGGQGRGSAVGCCGGARRQAVGQHPLCTAGTPLVRAAAAGPLSEPLGIVLCIRPGHLRLLLPDQTCAWMWTVAFPSLGDQRNDQRQYPSWGEGDRTIYWQI